MTTLTRLSVVLEDNTLLSKKVDPLGVSGLVTTWTSTRATRQVGWGLRRLQQITAPFRACEVRWLFEGAITPARLVYWLNRARQLSKGAYTPASFFQWFEVTVPSGLARAVAQALRARPEVRRVSRFPTTRPATEGARQAYRRAAPVGVGADHVSATPGAGAPGVRLVDLEHGWKGVPTGPTPATTGELRGVRFKRYGHDDETAHGASVLGIVLSRAGDSPASANCIGLAAEAKDIHLVGIRATVDGVLVEDPYRALAKALDLGSSAGRDLVLLETSVDWPVPSTASPLGFVSQTQLPLEADPLLAAGIRLLVANERIVIEAAGNAGLDLDTVMLYPEVTSDGEVVGQPTTRLLTPTGAILVGAATRVSASGWEPTSTSNRGAHVRVFGQGEGVWTIDPDAAGGYGEFDGTSAAAAIVAGCALSIQGMCDAVPRARRTPTEMSTLLARVGTEVLSGGRTVGTVPDLTRIATSR